MSVVHLTHVMTSVESLNALLCPHYWRSLCNKCCHIVDRQPHLLRDIHSLPSEGADPLQVFLQTNVLKNHRHLVAFVVWLSRRSDTYRQYRRVVLQESDSCVQSLLRLAVE